MSPSKSCEPLPQIFDNISQITRLSKRVISQYLDLIPQQHLQVIDENLANAAANDEAPHQGEPQ